MSGHTDVVPVDGQAWSTDPFKLEKRNGNYFGRGTADMKGFIAACLSAVPAWQRDRLKRPIHLAFSYDEEIGCLGVPRLVDRLKARVQAPALAIVGEPTGMRIGGTSEQQVGEGRADAPVGTTLAMIEQAAKVLNAVHKRMHAAQDGKAEQAIAADADECLLADRNEAGIARQ